jgi:hypothetical protein
MMTTVTVGVPPLSKAGLLVALRALSRSTGRRLDIGNVLDRSPSAHSI